MNNKRRELLKEAVRLLDRVSGIVNNALDQEQDSLDSMPENLQTSERCERMESVVGNLEDALSCIDEARIKLEDSVI